MSGRDAANVNCCVGRHRGRRPSIGGGPAPRQQVCDCERIGPDGTILIQKDDFSLERRGHSQCPVIDTQLAQNVNDVEFDCPLSNGQGVGDFLIAHTAVNELQDRVSRGVLRL
jgi:hypothetical protein